MGLTGKWHWRSAVLSAAFALASCGGDDTAGGGGLTPAPTPTSSPTPIPPPPITGIAQAAAIATFDSPWALEVMPDGRFLVTQRNETGAMSIVAPDGARMTVTGLPETIGLLDVALGPDFSVSRRVYFTAMVRDLSAPRAGRNAADPAFFPERMEAYRAVLEITGATARLTSVQRIFQQVPTIVSYPGSGEPGGRTAFAADGNLFITSGDRQELDTPFLFALDNNLGKTVRIRPDGSIPADNPHVGDASARPEIWSFGHRNHYGLAFAPDGNLWSSEMGPLGGDEFNLIKPRANYGWNAVSNGSYYEGGGIPDHAPGDGYAAPAVSWTPVIAPAGMLFYSGSVFGDWRGDALLTGLSSKAIIRVRVSGETASEVQRIAMGARVRDIAQAPDGSLYILTDGATGELRKITPVF